MAKAKPLKGLDIKASTDKNARIIAKQRLQEMYVWNKYVDNPSTIHELHNLRIAVKRLRYTLELFSDVLPEAASSIVDELTRIQDEIGAIHDSDVLIALLQLSLKNRGSVDEFTATLSEVEGNEQNERVELEPDLVADLMDLTAVPSAEEEEGLAQFLEKQERLREDQYAAFRQHWRQLNERDFRCEIITILESSS